MKSRSSKDSSEKQYHMSETEDSNEWNEQPADSAEESSYEEDPLPQIASVKLTEMTKNLMIDYQALQTTRTLAHYLNFLQECRHSAYYKNIKAKLLSNQDLLDTELLYFISTTEDTNLVPLKTLRRLYETQMQSISGNNLRVLLAAREWEAEDEPERKKALNLALQHALNKRACYHDRNREQHPMFLNLCGVHLEGADLSSTSLDCIDMQGGKLDRVIMNDVCISFSNFAQASFKSAAIGINNGVALLDAIFDQADFEASRLHHTSRLDPVNISMQNINAFNTTFTGMDYHEINFNGATFLPPYAFNSTQTLSTALNQFDQTTLQNLRVESKSAEWQLQKQIDILLKVVAGQIINGSNHIDFHRSYKLELINTAMEHPIFQPANSRKQCFNACSRGINKGINMFLGLFSHQNSQPIATHKTKSFILLEAVKNGLVKNNNIRKHS